MQGQKWHNCPDSQQRKRSSAPGAGSKGLFLSLRAGAHLIFILGSYIARINVYFWHCLCHCFYFMSAAGCQLSSASKKQKFAIVELYTTCWSKQCTFFDYMYTLNRLQANVSGCRNVSGYRTQHNRLTKQVGNYLKQQPGRAAWQQDGGEKNCRIKK